MNAMMLKKLRIPRECTENTIAISGEGKKLGLYGFGAAVLVP
jgi:hypothetical protein